MPLSSALEGIDLRGEPEVAAATDLSGVRGGCRAWQMPGLHHPQDHYLLDAEHAEAGPVHGAECGLHERPGFLAAHDLGLGDVIVLTIDPDCRASGRSHIPRPVGLVAERERDPDPVPAPPRTDPP